MGRREIERLLKENTGLQDEVVVKKLLNYLEMEFRKLCLNVLYEITTSGIILKSMYSEIASLQRPSWGCWNGFLLGVLKERRRILNTGSIEQREIVNKSKLLTWASIYMEQDEVIEDEKFKEKWQSIVGQTFNKKKKSAKVKELLSIPIQIRNRAAHDNVQDKTWWEDVNYILRYITEWHIKSEIEKYNSNIHEEEPWVFESDGELWCYNGIDTRAGENTVFYVSVSGKSKTDHQRDGSIILALQKILGEEDLQEANFKKLMNKLVPEELKGFFLGGYIVGEKSGEGGFAEVYKGVQLSTGRKVALKILKSGLSDTDKERFLQEAKYLSIFDHINIAKVYEQDEQPWRKSQLYDLSEEKWFEDFKKSHGSVVTYIAMEWIEGKTLDDIYLEMKSGEKNYEEREIAHWFMDASEALEVIHNANLIHRDISPKNIMITEDGIIKLMDFGISKTQYENHTIVTSHGKLLGSEPYMSPEQLDYERARSELGPRSDIYSLGSTFYELFTRTRLYNHNNEARSIATASQLKRKGERPKAPKLIDKKISWEISTILIGCLENEQSDRYSTAQSLNEDINRYLDDIPIKYRRPNVGRRLRLLYKRNRKVINITIMFIILIVILTAFYINSVVTERNKVELANKELEQVNIKLQDQIAQTEQQRNIATQNENEAKNQQKAAEENAKLAGQNAELARENEKKAIDNLNEAKKQRELAVSNEQLANENADKATKERIVAEENEKKAKEQRDQALTNQSLYLSNISNKVRSTGDKTLAMRIALSALPNDLNNPDRPYVPEAMKALYAALYDNQPCRSILKHDVYPQDAAISPDGKRLITRSGSAYDSLRIWDISSGKEIEEFKNLKSGWGNSCFSSDGARVSIISKIDSNEKGDENTENTACIYNVMSGEKINEFKLSNENDISMCSLSPKGDALLIKDENGVSSIFDVKSGEKINDKSVLNYTFSPDERIAVTSKISENAPYDIKIWDTNGKIDDINSWIYKGSINVVSKYEDIVFSKDSNKMAVITGNYEVKVYDLEDLTEVKTIGFSKDITDNPISCVNLNNDGSMMAIAFWNGNAKIFDVNNQKEFLQINHEGPSYPDISEGEPQKTAKISDISFSYDSSFIVTASYAGNAKIWDTKTGEIVSTYEHEGYLDRAIISQDQNKLITLSRDKTAKIWEIQKSNITENIVKEALFYNFDGTNIKYDIIRNGSTTNNLKEYNIMNNTIKDSLGYNDEKNIGEYGGSKKAKIYGNDVVILDQDNSNEVSRFSLDVKYINDASLNSDGKLLGVSSIDKSDTYSLIDLYDISSHQLIHRWKIDRSTRADVNFSNDCTKLIVCTLKDGKTWNMISLDTQDFTEKLIEVNNSYPNYAISRNSDSIFVLENFEDYISIRDVINNREIIKINNDFGWTSVNAYFNEDSDLLFINTNRQEGAGAASAGKFCYKCFDLNTGNELFTTDKGYSEIKCIEFAKDKSMVAFSDGTNKCFLWDIKSGNEIAEIPTKGNVEGISFDAEDKKLTIISSLLSSYDFSDKYSDIYIDKIDLLSPASAVEYARKNLGDSSLSNEEKKEYFAIDSN